MTFFDLLSFDETIGMPKAVWVRDQADREFKKRLSRKQRRELAEATRNLRQRLGPTVKSQTDSSEVGECLMCHDAS